MDKKEKAKNILRSIKKLYPTLCSKDETDSFWVFYFCYKIIKRPYPPLEILILDDALNCSRYASYVLFDRFKAGEKIIIKDKVRLKRYLKWLQYINKFNEFEQDYPNMKITFSDDYFIINYIE